MVSLDFKALTERLGVVRILEVVFTCVCFSLVASVGYSPNPFWTWCMFSWCFCFCVTILILIVEFTSLTEKVPLSWVDFTSAFSLLATLMVMMTTIFCIYSTLVAYSFGGRQIAASVFSFITVSLYAKEVEIVRARPGEINVFLSTVPGLLKVLQTFMACIIFICLRYIDYWKYAGLQWCVFVYSICFIFSFLIIILTICRLLALLQSMYPPFNKVLTVCNVLAVLMYITAIAVVIWHLYSSKDITNSDCIYVHQCPWYLSVVISVMTGLNLAVYIVDTVYSFKLSFITARET